MADLLVCDECDGIEGAHRESCRWFRPATVIARLKAEVVQLIGRGAGDDAWALVAEEKIARLKAEVAALRVTADEAIVEHLVARKEVERLKAELAALRLRGAHEGFYENAADEVEAAQETAMKGGGES